MAREPFIFIRPPLTPPPLDSNQLTVSGDEAHHLIKVLRAKIGQRFIGFDGKGHGWRAEITSISRNDLTARIIEPIMDSPSRGRTFLFGVHLEVAVGVIKRNRMDWAVEKAAELGAVRFLPLTTRYSVVSPGQGRVERWRSIALSATKQSRRLWLMDVSQPLPLEQAVEDASSDPASGMCALVLNDDTIPLMQIWNGKTNVKRFVLFIGPEGGFSSDEVELFRHTGISLASIGEKPLRTETAVAVALGTLINTPTIR